MIEQPIQTNDFFIWKPGLLSTLLILSEIVSYRFDDSDFDAIEYGLQGTSDEERKLFDYKLTGQQTMALDMAYDAEDRDMIHFRLQYPATLHAQVDLGIYVVQCFDLKPRHYKAR